jgi:hypothetical protein
LGAKATCSLALVNSDDLGRLREIENVQNILIVIMKSESDEKRAREAEFVKTASLNKQIGGSAKEASDTIEQVVLIFII